MSSVSRLVVALVVAALVPLGASAAAADDLVAARALAGAGKHGEALARVETALASRPGDPGALLLKGVILAGQDRSEEAIRIFDELARTHPELPEPHNNLAVLHAAAGDYAQAREALLVAINTHPSYATAYENLGDVYAQMAAVAYDEALRLGGSNPGTVAKLALIDRLFSAPSAEGTVSAAVARSEPAPEAPVAVARAEPAPAAAAGRAPESSAPGSSAPGSSVEPRADPDAVLTTLVAWGQAWSRQDVEAYLGFYAEAFEPGNGASRARWTRERRRRLRAPAFIDVDLLDAEVAMRGERIADVTFTQNYRSNSYEDRVRKRISMQWTGTQWKIVDELTIP